MHTPWLVLFTMFHHIPLFSCNVVTSKLPGFLGKQCKTIFSMPFIPMPFNRELSVEARPSQCRPKLCKDCIYFKPVNMKGDTPIGDYYSECALFTNYNVVTGEISHMLASDARNSIIHCTKMGLFFDPKDKYSEKKIDEQKEDKKGSEKETNKKYLKNNNDNIIDM